MTPYEWKVLSEQLKKSASVRLDQEENQTSEIRMSTRSARLVLDSLAAVAEEMMNIGYRR